MALYWPQYNMALQIDDDPYSLPFDHDAYPQARVFHTTVSEMSDPVRATRMARRMANEMGIYLPPDTAESLAQRKILFRTLFTDNKLMRKLYPQISDAA